MVLRLLWVSIHSGAYKVMGNRELCKSPHLQLRALSQEESDGQDSWQSSIARSSFRTEGPFSCHLETTLRGHIGAIVRQTSLLPDQQSLSLCAQTPL